MISDQTLDSLINLLYTSDHEWIEEAYCGVYKSMDKLARFKWVIMPLDTKDKLLPPVYYNMFKDVEKYVINRVHKLDAARVSPSLNGMLVGLTAFLKTLNLFGYHRSSLLKVIEHRINTFDQAAFDAEAHEARQVWSLYQLFLQAKKEDRSEPKRIYRKRAFEKPVV